MPGKEYSLLSDWGQNTCGLASETAPEFTDIYTACGMKVSTMSRPGVYIVEGRKIVRH